MNEIYDPIKFVGKTELLTIAVLGSFVTFKLFNALYENVYEPSIDSIINSDKTDKYYVKIGAYYIQIGMIFKEFIKWVILIFIIMLLYNLIMKGRRKARLI